MPDWFSTLEWTHPAWLLALAGLPLAALILRRLRHPAVSAASTLRTAGHAAIAALLVCALAAPNYRLATSERFVVLVVDQSDSIRGPARVQAEKFVDGAAELKGRHRVAVLPFAGRAGQLQELAAAVHHGDQPHGSPGSGSGSRSTLASSAKFERQASNPARAVLAAAAQMPVDYVGEIVLLTDGAQTGGDLQKGTVGAGVPISVVPLVPLAGPEVCLAELTTPAYAAPRDDFEVDVVIESNQADAGTLTLVCADQTVAERRIELKAGRNVVPLRPLMPDVPRAVFKAELRSFQDTTSENNWRSTIVYALDRPRVLILATDAPAAEHFAALLDSQGFEASSLTPAGLEKTSERLDRSGVLVLLNVPAADLPEESQRRIERFARAGGGVLGTGGAATFATAGYRHTVLEEILPVSALAEPEPRQASLALALVIDKSGSMGDDQRLELAKLAARRVVNLLGPQDQIGVLAFATDSNWVTPIAPDTNKPQLEERIAALRAGGGTNMYPAMQKAALALSEAVADHKQMILLTDGISVPGDFQDLAESLAQEQISVSTVSIGGEADRGLLREIAKTTHGRPYHCENPADIPRVVVEEAVVAAAATASHARPLVLHQLPRLNAADAPPLTDSVATAAKPPAEVLLLTAAGDPLLSWWRFGSGVTLAYTAQIALADNIEAGSQDREAQFWARVVRQALGRTDTNPWDIQLVRAARRARITAEALSPDGTFLNDAKVGLTVTEPAGGQHAADMPLVAPGRYQADIDLEALGAYEFELRLEGPSAQYVERCALTLDYPDELRLAAQNESLLREVCLASGGRYDPRAEDLFAADGRTATRSLPLWRYCILAAVVLIALGAVWRRFEGSAA